MASLSAGEYLVTNLKWHREDEEDAFRPLHGFTTGKLKVRGTNVRLWARFNDQFLSNRLSDLDEDRVPIELLVTVLESDDIFRVSGSPPSIDRSGASYQLNVKGNLHDEVDGAPA